VLEIMMLGRVFGPNRKEEEAGENSIIRSFIIFTIHMPLLGD
jgi:hypothetical protein